MRRADKSHQDNRYGRCHSLSSNLLKPSAPNRVIVGEVRRSWGYQGEMAITQFSDDSGQLKEGQRIFLDGKPTRILGSKPGPKHSLLLRVESVGSIDHADNLRGALIEVKETDLPQQRKWKYYHYQILGAKVQDDDGNELGTIAEIISTGANDVYVVSTVSSDQADILIPALRDVVLEVNVGENTITVDLPEGLH